ncbi:hypothetical protein ACTA71_006938 [Dictyostelium dimigraforme]
MKITILLIISIIGLFSICNAIKIPKTGVIGNQQWINFLPYDDYCINPIEGIGFGSVAAGTCMANFTTEYGFSISMEIDSENANYVNLTSYGPTCSGDYLSSQLLVIDHCTFFEFSKTNYKVILTSQPQVPKDTYVIMNNDQFCQEYINYWFATPGLTIPDVERNQTSTYSCKGKIPYVTFCSGTPPGCVYLKNYQTCEVFQSYSDIFCTQ